LINSRPCGPLWTHGSAGWVAGEAGHTLHLHDDVHVRVPEQAGRLGLATVNGKPPRSHRQLHPLPSPGEGQPAHS